LGRALRSPPFSPDRRLDSVAGQGWGKPMLELQDFMFSEDDAQARHYRDGRSYHFWEARRLTEVISVYVDRTAIHDMFGPDPGEGRERLLRSREKIQEAANRKWRPGDDRVFLEESDFLISAKISN
jgi:hypothetical protein